jgi:hypothetical protein
MRGHMHSIKSCQQWLKRVQQLKYLVVIISIIFAFIYYMTPVHADTMDEENVPNTEVRLKRTGELQGDGFGGSYSIEGRYVEEAETQSYSSFNEMQPLLEAEKENAEEKLTEKPIKALKESYQVFHKNMLNNFSNMTKNLSNGINNLTVLIENLQSEVIKITKEKVLNIIEAIKTQDTQKPNTALPYSDDIEARLVVNTKITLKTKQKQKGDKDASLLLENIKVYGIEAIWITADAVFCAVQKQEKWITRQQTLF